MDTVNTPLDLHELVSKNPLRSNVMRWKLARVGVVIFTISLIMSSFLGGYLMYKAKYGVWTSINEHQTMLTVSGFVGTILLICFLFAMISFILWFARLYNNLVLTDAYHHQYKPFWAVIAWFIPIANWIIPSQIMHEIWGDYPDYINSYGNGTPVEEQPKGILKWWWSPWVIGCILSRISFKFGGVEFGIFLSSLAVVLMLISLVHLLKMMRIIRDWEDRVQLFPIPEDED